MGANPMTPAPPPGFELDQKPDALNAPPPPPAGFQLDQQPGKPSMMDTILNRSGISGATELAKGAAKGAASTVFHAGDLIRRGEMGIAHSLGVDPQNIPPHVRSFFGLDRVIDNPEVKAAITPTNVPQQVGFYGEHAAEMLAPSGAVGAGAKAIEGATAGMRGAQALNIGGRAALDAAAAGGVAGAQTGGDPKAMGEAAAGAGVGSAVLGTAGAMAPKIAGKLQQAAKDQYSRVLNPTTKGNKFLTQNQVAEGMLDRGVSAVTMKGLQQKTADQVSRLGGAISDAWDNLPAGTSVKLQPVLDSLDTEAKNLHTLNVGGNAVPMGPEAKTALGNVSTLKKTLTDIAEQNPQTGDLEIPVDRVRKLRQYFDGIAAKAGRYEGKTLADASTAEAHGMAADAIREQLAQQHPDIDAINKEYSFWKNANKVVSDTVSRRTGQAKPLGRKLAQAAGTAAGFSTGGVHGAVLGRAAMESIEAAISSPAWNTVSAVMKARMANAIAAGDETAIQNLMRSAIGASVTEPRPLASPEQQ